ncbi:MAG TPA: branched-chain amino acid ABC transporter permease [Acidimicrobiales bacterium]|nr:branched-chain amino acid ABC transporter permease [Acidimicrobiales bacterium]
MSNVNYYLVTLVFFGAVNGLQAIGLDMQFGQAGIFNFAYIVLVAVGAYATGIASIHPAGHSGLGALTYIGGFGWAFPWNMLFGVLATVVFAFILTSIAFRRLRHDYLALTLVTIGSALLLLITNQVNIFNGETGIVGVPGPWQSQLSSSAWYITMGGLALFILAVNAYIFWRIQRAPLGRLFKALREDEILVASLGKNPARVKMTAFLLGAVSAGLAGSLFVLFIGGWGVGGWQPGETFVLFAAVLLGGRGRLTGALLGAFVLYEVFLQGSSLLNIPLAPGILPAVQQLFVGIVLLVVLWLRPAGLLPEHKEKFPGAAATSRGSKRRRIARQPRPALGNMNSAKELSVE